MVLRSYAQGPRLPDRLHRLINHLVNDPYSLMHHEWWGGQHRDLSDSGIVVGLKLDYGGIPSLNTPMRLKCNALDAELLKRPVTLGVWIGKGNCYLLDEDGISERLRLESLVEAAIQAERLEEHSSGDAEINISEDPIWQEEVNVGVKHGNEKQ
jgi:hypothetical protein